MLFLNRQPLLLDAKHVRLARYMLRECKVVEPEQAHKCEQHPRVVRSEQTSGGSLADKPKPYRNVSGKNPQPDGANG